MKNKQPVTNKIVLFEEYKPSTKYGMYEVRNCEFPIGKELQIRENGVKRMIKIMGEAPTQHQYPSIGFLDFMDIFYEGA
jgi:hypothetical protein